MRYLSVCSGIEAATVAWHPLGWTPVAFSEIEPFPAAVLAHHYPTVPNYGDMTKHKEWPLGPGSIDLLVGGTPCQSFSVAGLRKGISDPRGGLMLTYLEIAQRLRPRWIVWENVPGVLSSGGGRDFGSFLGALGELGYGWAYRVLDAQWVRTQRHPRAVPQRRRRVFVVGCLGDGERAAQVFFECESVQRDSAPRRAQGQGVAADAEAGVGAGCWLDGGGCAGTLTKQNAGGAQRMPDKDNFGAVLQPVGYRWQNDRDGLIEDGTAPACRASAGSSGFHEMNHPVVVQQPVPIQDGRGVPVMSIQGAATRTNPASGPDGVGVSQSGVAYTLEARAEVQAVAQPVPFDLFQITAPVNRQNRKPGDPCHTLARDNAAHAAVAFNWQNGGGYGNANEGLGITVEGTGPIQRCNTPAVAHALRAEGFDAGEDGTGRGTPLVPVAPTLTAHNDPSRSPQSSEFTQQVAAVHAASMTVRRLTPRECERLQAFPDDYTLIPWRKKPAAECPDGPRYKALGNSMAVNCMAWIGERIAAVEARHD